MTWRPVLLGEGVFFARLVSPPPNAQRTLSRSASLGLPDYSQVDMQGVRNNLVTLERERTRVVSPNRLWCFGALYDTHIASSSHLTWL